MENKKINEKELENVSGGVGVVIDITTGQPVNFDIPGRFNIPVGKYPTNQRVKFRNPENREEILTGTIMGAIATDENGECVYSIHPEYDGPHYILPHKVKESDILGTV